MILFLGAFIEPPTTEGILSAIKRLENVGALDKDGNLTPLGHHLAALPVDVRIGEVIFYHKMFTNSLPLCHGIYPTDIIK